MIELLPRQAQQRVLAQCDEAPLVLSQVLYEPGQAIRHVYFPVEGFVSLIAVVEHHPGLEVGMVGREGMLGAHLMLGVAAAPQKALVQGAGFAWRMGSAAFRRELALNAALRTHLQRYVHVLMCQLTASATCLRFHQIGPRLARWLLMSQDRAHADRFVVTHEFLALMLGVRRVGITLAAGSLQRAGLITYHRGELQVLDRRGLEAAACTCYGADRQAYAALLA